MVSSSSDMRALCVKNGYYDLGDNNDYSKMLESVSSWSTYQVALDIFKHTYSVPLSQINKQLSYIENRKIFLSKYLELLDSYTKEYDGVPYICFNDVLERSSFSLAVKSMLYTMYNTCVFIQNGGRVGIILYNCNTGSIGLENKYLDYLHMNGFSIESINGFNVANIQYLTLINIEPVYYKLLSLVREYYINKPTKYLCLTYLEDSIRVLENSDTWLKNIYSLEDDRPKLEDGYMYVSDLESNYKELDLPKIFVDTLPKICPSCGFPLKIRESLTGLSCSNPRCVDKIAKRIEMICSDLNILYFGESTIYKFIDTYNVTNPIQMFGLEDGDLVFDGASPELSSKIINQILAKRDFLLWEYVMYSNIPNVRTSARKIFQGYEDLEEAYKDIEKGGVSFIQDKLGLSVDTASLQAIKVYNSLLEYKNDLLEGLIYVNIIKLGNVKEINVVCSDEVGAGFRKKAEFYDYINKNFSDKVHVNFLSSVSKSIDYLVWKGADGSPARYTSKVKTVEGWNSKGKTNIPIITAEQFISVMHDL